MSDISIALSGGGAKGAAHVGVLRALYEWDIVPAVVSGTSAGSIVGAFICDGFHPEEISEMLKKLEFKYRINFWKFKQGALSIEPIEKILKENLRSKKFEQLQKPLYVTASDLNTGKAKVFSEGDLLTAITASCSIPFVFPPVYIDDVPYVDGGMSANLPVAPLLHYSNKIVGVNVNPVDGFDHEASVAKNIDRMFHLMIRENILDSVKKCDVFIEPPALEKYHIFDYKHLNEMEEIGYDYVKSKHLAEKIKGVFQLD